LCAKDVIGRPRLGHDSVDCYGIHGMPNGQLVKYKLLHRFWRGGNFRPDAQRLMQKIRNDMDCGLIAKHVAGKLIIHDYCRDTYG
jgi:hypothetical protein